MQKVCYIAGREAGYSRTRIVLKALEKAGFEVTTCLPPNKSFKHYPALIFSFLKKKRNADLVVVGFYGQLLMPFVRLLTRKPVLYDLYISTFDTMVYDRGKAGSKSLMARLYYLSDRFSMKQADGILLETVDHIRDYAKKFKIPESKFYHLFLAVDDDLIPAASSASIELSESSESFKSSGSMEPAKSSESVEPSESSEPQSESSGSLAPEALSSKNGTFRVHFHGEYAPFHGVKHIIRAAALLHDKNVEFDIIGTGITYEVDRKLAEALDVKNIRFIDWIPYESLGRSMQEADCSLGIFGENPRTLRVLTNKVVEALAVGSPLITAKNDPVQELVTDGESALLVPRADSEALADAILKLKNDEELRLKISAGGKKVFEKHCTLNHFSQQLKTIVERMAAA